MAKTKTIYSCTECGGQVTKWQGQCPHCDAWNTLVESVAEVAAGGKNRFSALASTGKVQMLAEVEAAEVPRTPTGIVEFDRVLGGGLVQGAVVLIGGDPGIGKSTLLLQTLAHLSSHKKVLYVSGEESTQQIALRAKRLVLDARAMHLLAEIQLEKIQSVIAQEKPDVVVIDSIQTVYSEQLTSAPGSVSQVRECAAQLTRVAKSSNITMILVGHVTKEGALAGPRVLEHIVDTVLYFEGDTHSSFRLVRAFKNRFGAVNELGVFAMTEKGLREVSNPSALFLSQHGAQVAGSCVMVTQEGTRPLLVEIQALLDEAHSPSPRRLVTGPGAEPAGDAAGRAAPPCGHRLFRSGRVHQRGGRREDHRAGCRPRGAARDRVIAQEQTAAGKTGGVRRSGSGRRGASGAARPGTPERSSQAGIHARDHSQGQYAEAKDRGHGDHRGGAGRRGGQPDALGPQRKGNDGQDSFGGVQ